MIVENMKFYTNNKTQLSIIIAHYCTEQSSLGYNSFIKTLNTIKEQSDNYKIEVIIADDGSLYSKDIVKNYTKSVEIKNDNRKLFILKDTQLKTWIKNLNIDSNLITNWLYIPKLTPCMSKARLWNYASQYAQSDNLFFLDDDARKLC